MRTTHYGNKYTTSLEIRQAWVNFLNKFVWDWFATLTFADPPKTYTAENKLNAWIKAIEREEKRKIGYFKAMEFTKQGVPHFHLLMGNLQGVERSKYWGLWFSKNGRARILPYNSKLGAGYYLTKYVVKEDCCNAVNWEVRGLEYMRQLVLDNQVNFWYT